MAVVDGCSGRVVLAAALTAACVACDVDRSANRSAAGQAGTTASPTAFSGFGTGQPRPPQATGAPGTSPPAAPPGGAAVRIAAVELHPEDPMPGGEFVVIRNHGEAAVTVDCWTVDTGTGSPLQVRADAPLEAGAALRLLAESSVPDASVTVSLLDGAGDAVDRTPALTDTTGDDQLWHRTPSGDWAFGREYRLSPDTEDGRLVTDTC